MGRGAPDPQFLDPARSGFMPDPSTLDPSRSIPDTNILDPAGFGSRPDPDTVDPADPGLGGRDRIVITRFVT